MKRTAVLLILVCLASGGTLFAQTGKVAVKKGSKLTYAINTRLDVTQNTGAQDKPMVTVADGSADLVAKKMAAGKIDWSYGVTKLHLAIQNPLMSGGGRDTTMKGKPLAFSTSPAGRLIDSAKLVGDPALAAIGGGVQGNSVSRLFSPALSRALNVGDSWEEIHTDTLENFAVPGVKVVLRQTTRFTYEGDVDTLNTRAVRVRGDVTALSILGDVVLKGMKVKVYGDGKNLTHSYYSKADGLLLNSDGKATITMRMVMMGQTQTVIPLLYKVSTVMARAGR